MSLYLYFWDISRWLGALLSGQDLWHYILSVLYGFLVNLSCALVAILLTTVHLSLYPECLYCFYIHFTPPICLKCYFLLNLLVYKCKYIVSCIVMLKSSKRSKSYIIRIIIANNRDGTLKRPCWALEKLVWKELL